MNYKEIKKQQKEERKLCGDFYQGLVDQIEGLINIEIGNYLYEESDSQLSLYFNRWTNGGLDVYIYDDKYSYINNYNKLDMKLDIMPIIKRFNIDDMILLEHLHYEDMLWFIMNFKEEKKHIIKRIDEYIKWKENNEVE